MRHGTQSPKRRETMLKSFDSSNIQIENLECDTKKLIAGGHETNN